MDNRRKHERYTADRSKSFKTKLAFMYELLDDNVADGINIHREGLSTIINISKSGCFIHCFSPFPLSTRLLITMVPPDFPNDKIVVTGIIVREVPYEHDGYCYGVDFMEYHDDSRTMLNEFVSLLTG